jgi:hypothetical protein
MQIPQVTVAEIFSTTSRMCLNGVWRERLKEAGTVPNLSHSNTRHHSHVKVEVRAGSRQAKFVMIAAYNFLIEVVEPVEIGRANQAVR